MYIETIKQIPVNGFLLLEREIFAVDSKQRVVIGCRTCKLDHPLGADNAHVC